METLKKTAYLREFTPLSQCELMFSLKVDLQTIGPLEEDIKAVRQLTDTVGSLLQHVVNKINKIIQTLKEERNVAADQEIATAINISLVRRSLRKPLKETMVLKNLIKSNPQDVEFEIFNQSYHVTINAPLVREIKLPFILYANFSVQPSKFYVLFAEKNNCQYTWYKSKDKVNWTQVGSSYRYIMGIEDIDHFLKLVCVPFNKHLTGPPAEAISENKVEKMGDLPVCPFEKRHEFTKNKLVDNCFRVVSYNLLSSRYAETNEQFPYCSPKVLAPDYRKQLITKELLGYQADIMCLQEVDSCLYTGYYKDLFKKNGYMSYYHRKGNKIPEGLACFFNKSRFKKLEDRQIIYSAELKTNRLFSYLLPMITENANLKELFMKQMTSLHVTVMKMKEDNQCIIMANTHLFYRSDAELVRIVQANMATTFLAALCRIYSNNGDRVNVILCGDFNSTPSSAVFDYMTTGKISKTHQVFKDVTHVVDLVHNFQFESACGKPKYTNYTLSFKDCLDYIYIEKSKIKVINVVPFPAEEELSNYEGLPNDVYPSDHLSLVVDLQFT